MSPSVHVWGYRSVCYVCVSCCCLSACSCGHVCLHHSPGDLPGHTMGSTLHILPWPPAQTTRPPWSRFGLAQVWPLPVTSIPQGSPNGFSVTASTSGLSSAIHTPQSEGSFQTADSVSSPTASNPDSRTRDQELTFWVWPWLRAPASCPVSQSTLECFRPVTCRVAPHL